MNLTLEELRKLPDRALLALVARYSIRAEATFYERPSSVEAGYSAAWCNRLAAVAATDPKAAAAYSGWRSIAAAAADALDMFASDNDGSDDSWAARSAAAAARSALAFSSGDRGEFRDLGKRALEAASRSLRRDESADSLLSADYLRMRNFGSLEPAWSSILPPERAPSSPIGARLWREVMTSLGDRSDFARAIRITIIAPSSSPEVLRIVTLQRRARSSFRDDLEPRQRVDTPASAPADDYLGPEDDTGAGAATPAAPFAESPDDVREPAIPAPPAPAESSTGWLRRFRSVPSPAIAARVSIPGAGARLGVPSKPSPEPGRIVNTGFSSQPRPDTSLSPRTRLRSGSRYWFWVEIGPAVADSIEVTRVSLQNDLPDDAVLDVVLFSFPDGLKIPPKARVGRIALRGDGKARVLAQPALTDTPAQYDERLFFPLRTRFFRKRQQLRCNIYYNNVLLQSRLVTAVVRLLPKAEEENVLTSRVDFVLSRSLEPSRLRSIGSHSLSIMLNDGDNPSSHQFRFFGASDFVADVSLGALALSTQIEEVRRALRRVCWGSPDEWNQESYRYDTPTLDQLRVDLVRLAKAGYRFYDAFERKLTSDKKEQLAELTRAPGRIQIASRSGLLETIPAGLIYDYPLLTTLEGEHTLCPAFLRALDRHDTASVECFAGKCPSYGTMTMVCPSGFWGFRHEIGVPLSLGDGVHDLPSHLGCTTDPKMLLAVCTAPEFKLQAKHVESLRMLATSSYADSQATALALLPKQGHHVVYFYCHGGTSGEIPYILLGPPDKMGITPDNLRAVRVSWSPPGPLVFINGCHTAALSPWKPSNFVDAFISTSHATGVIGTDITVFEPLASRFGEMFLDSFLKRRATVGIAMRDARVQLLNDRNPLGLAYIAFALASLTLSPTT